MAMAMDSSSSSSPCSLDSEYAEQIAALLAPPPPQLVKDYYDKLIEERKCQGIRVKDENKFGKGVYADMEFKEGELVLKDEMLAAAQHSSNKVDCLVCSHCFCYIGSIELQIGRKLLLQDMGLSDKKECHHGTYSSTSKEVCGAELLEEDENEDSVMDDDDAESSHNREESYLSKEVLESLINGDLSLPYTKQFFLPPVISCPGGCEEEHYCSKLCAESDWESFHSLLCTGEKVGSSRRAALLKFIDHANRTNDIFILAAKVISYAILKYKKLRGHLEDGKQKTRLDVMNGSKFSLFLESWKPISMGFKRRWWDCIALPDDVAVCDETSFRMQIRDLAYASLQLLKDAIFDAECAPLFSLEIYGHIIGMFELNNLGFPVQVSWLDFFPPVLYISDLVVASPVEDYFIYIDDLPVPDKEEAEKLTRPFLDALGDDYSVCCEGTAFFPLQSCMNHSCCPNAKAFKRDEDRDGKAVIIALRHISKGEEITISYIDEDLPYGERQALLADYGFKCTCKKCSEKEP